MRTDWRAWAAEAAAIALFMVSATACTVALEHPASWLRQALPDDLIRRAGMGVAMGTTAVALIYSPLGARSGAHMNPAVTLAFWRLGRLGPADAGAYVVAQCVGAIAGTWAIATALGPAAAHPSVAFVKTVPGSAGVAAAAIGEFAISFVLFAVVLTVSGRPSTMRFAGLVAGVLVMANIVVEAPLSGMSMNPARSLGPAVVAGDFTAFWLYALVPPAGMQLAATLHRALATRGCARLNHTSRVRCIFCAA